MENMDEWDRVDSFCPTEFKVTMSIGLVALIILLFFPFFSPLSYSEGNIVWWISLSFGIIVIIGFFNKFHREDQILQNAFIYHSNLSNNYSVKLIEDVLNGNHYSFILNDTSEGELPSFGIRIRYLFELDQYSFSIFIPYSLEGTDITIGPFDDSSIGDIRKLMRQISFNIEQDHTEV